MKNRNVLLSYLTAFLLLVSLTSQTLATDPKEGEDSNKKLSSSFFTNETMSGAGTAKVFESDKGKKVKFANPYNQYDELYVFSGTFEGEVDDETAYFYCIDIRHGIGFYSYQHPHKYTDAGPTSDEITYILNHYYPYKSLPYPGSLSEDKEAAAVQLAIWHYADGLVVSSIQNYEIRNRVEEIVSDTDANAESFNPLETLYIVPASQTLPSGDDAEFHVETYNLDGDPLSGLTVELSTTSGSLSTTSAVTDATGATPTITLSQGGSLNAVITATANVKVPQGTRYVHKVEPDTYQKLVLATPAGLSRENTAEVNWQPFDPDDCDGDGDNNVSIFDGFKFEFDGVTNNGNGTSTWTYTVTGVGANRDLSHWVLALCEDHEIIDASYPGKWEVVNDPTTGIYGIKWDKEVGKNGDSKTFSFTINGVYDIEVVDVAFKAGWYSYYCTINGPSCEESQDCENKLGDYIWHDKNINGIQDADEQGIEGVVVELLQGNSIIETTTTDQNGYYEFAELPNGTYKVRVASSNYQTGGILESNDQTKWYATKKNQGSDDSKDSDADKNESVTVELNCADNMTIDFGFYKTCVSLIKEANKETAEVGDLITYTFTVENCGDVTLRGGVDVYDALINPNENHHIKNITPVYPGESKSFTKTYTVTDNDCGELINTAMAVGHPEDGSADVKSSASATVTIDCEPELEPIIPLLECVIDNGDGTYTAYFGYLNNNTVSVTIPVGADNNFSPAPQDRNQPTEFEPGRTEYWPDAEFSVTFNEGETLTWTLDGNTATANEETVPCSEQIYFDKKWFDPQGNLMDEAPENLPSNYKIEVTSDFGSAVGQYNNQNQLIFTYSNNPPATNNNGLWVPVNGEYTVVEHNLPSGYSELDGVGTYTAQVPGGYATNPYNNKDKYGLHVVKNQKDEEEECVEDWSVELGPDSTICEYEPQWITIDGTVHLTPNPSRAKLQLAWRIVHPNRPDIDNSTHYESFWITKDTNFTITAWWPGITAQDTLVEIHYGVNVLDCEGNPIKNGVGRDLYWYPWVCEPPQEEDVDIEVEKTASSFNPEDGDQVTYTVTASNNGPGDATGVQVTDILPDGVIYISHNASEGAYDNNTGVWNIGSIANGDYETLSITVEVDADSMNNATFDLGPAQDYNLFVFYDLNQPSSDTEGKIAVGRDANLSYYSVGDKLAPNSGDVLTVGRNLQYTSGRVYNGNVVYGSSTNLPLSAVSIDGDLRNDHPINFAAAKTYLQNLSTTLAGYSVNGTTTYQWTGLTLDGTDPYLNVFEVDGADLTESTSMTINVPNGSAVLVNISGNNINWSGGLTVNGTAIANVLYNFYETTSMTIQGIDVRGSILAPFAHVNFAAGVQNGQMICKSLEGMGQFNNTKFVGNIPVINITNVAALTAVIQDDTDESNNSGSVTIAVNGSGSGSGGGSGSTGDNWEYIDSFLEGQIVWAMTHHTDGSILVGTWGGAVYKSNTDGTNFTRINEGMNVGFIWSLLVHEGYIYAGTEQGIFKYNGSSWTKIGLDGKDIRSLAEANGVMYAGVWGGGVYVSFDSGNTWSSITSGGILEYAAVHDIAVNTNVDDEIYVATLGLGISMSNDGGASWNKLDLGYEFVWSVGITSGNIIFAGTYGDGLYASNDNGSSWYKVDLNANYIYDITVDDEDNVYVSTLLGGVYVSTDNGASFNSEGMGGFGVSSMLTTGSSENPSLIVGTSDGSLYKKSENGITAVNDEKQEELPTEFRLDQNYPNPFNPSTTIQFAIPKAGSYKLVIYNILGERVTTLVDGQLNAGTHSFNFNASHLASGIYIYQLVGDNKVNITKKMVLMK